MIRRFTRGKASSGVFRFSTRVEATDVLIVGAGPVGMLTSSLLNHFKIQNKLIEKASVI